MNPYPNQPPSPPKTGLTGTQIFLILLIGIPTLCVGGCVACVIGVGLLAPKGDAVTPPPQVSVPPVPDQSDSAPNGRSSTSVGKLELVKSVWVRDGFGSVAVWRVTFKNPTNQKIGNIKYRTIYYSETNNVVDKGGVEALADRTIQKVIEPKKTRTIEINDGFLHEQAAKATFELVSYEVIH